MVPPLMFPSAFRQVIALDRTQLRARSSLLCMITIAAALAVGLALHRPVIGMIAAGGAMTIGLGSFQQVGKSRLRPMLWTSLGMGVSSLSGSAVGHSGPGAMLNAGWVGFAAGLLLALGPGAAWVGLQCGIAALVASGYPTGPSVALSRGLLLMTGGLAQTAVVFTCWHFRSPWKLPAASDPYPGLLPALRVLRKSLSPGTIPCRFAIRLSLTLAIGAGLSYYLRLPNGYWVPMTALLVIKPDFQQTISRGLARVGGTIIGAILATLLVTELRPNLLMLAVLIVLFAWMAYSIVLVNYGIFSACLTAYIVFLLAFAGLPARAVVWHRTMNTTLGGTLALLSYATGLWIWRRSPPKLPSGAVAAAHATIPDS
jgi:hypothetical protein